MGALSLCVVGKCVSARNGKTGVCVLSVYMYIKGGVSACVYECV